MDVKLNFKVLKSNSFTSLSLGSRMICRLACYCFVYHEVSTFNALMEFQSSTSDYERGKLPDRLAKFSGGIAVLKIGGAK